MTEREIARRNSHKVPKNRMYKATLTGRYGVGKTSLFLRLQDKPLPDSDSSRTACLDKFEHVVDSTEGPVQLTVWDTAGMERNRSLTDGYYRNSHAIVMVFDITERESMHDCRDIADAIKSKLLSPHAKFFLIANKTDMSTSLHEEQSSVTQFVKGCESKQINFSAVHFTSAKDDKTTTIKEIFSDITKRLMDIKDAQPLTRSYNEEFKLRSKPKSTRSCC